VLKEITIVISVITLATCIFLGFRFFAQTSGTQKLAIEIQPKLEKNQQPKRLANRLIESPSIEGSLVGNGDSQKFKQGFHPSNISVAESRENSDICRWTVGRLHKLDNVIRLSGQGNNSPYCEEYDQRRRELTSKNCLDKDNVNYRATC